MNIVWILAVSIQFFNYKDFSVVLGNSNCLRNVSEKQNITIKSFAQFFHHGQQFQLPKLPLPDVPATMSRLIDAIKAVEQDAGQVEQVREQAELFQKDEGLIKEIERFLIEKSEKEENWVG